MKRFIDDHLKAWAGQKHFKPLLLRGARQVGKTYAARELGKDFDVFVEINLEINSKVRDLFALDLYPQRIIQEISYLTKQNIVPGKTLLFFDEIQAEPKAIQALRYFYEMMPELHVIAAGSLIDFALESVGVPVGRVEFLYMYPVSFLEFINALGESTLLKAILEHNNEQPLSSIAHDRLLHLIKEYLAIGGMPETVHVWAQKRTRHGVLKYNKHSLIRIGKILINMRKRRRLNISMFCLITYRCSLAKNLNIVPFRENLGKEILLHALNYLPLPA